MISLPADKQYNNEIPSEMLEFRHKLLKFLALVVFIGAFGYVEILLSNTAYVQLPEGHYQDEHFVEGVRQILLSDLRQLRNIKTIDLGSQNGRVEPGVPRFVVRESFFDLKIELIVTEQFRNDPKVVLNRFSPKKGQDQLLDLAISQMGVSVDSKQLKALKSNHPNDSTVLYLIGKALDLKKSDKYVDAMRTFQRGINLDPQIEILQKEMRSLSEDLLGKLRSPYKIGEVYEYLGMDEKALNEYDRMLSKNEEHARAMISKSRVLVRNKKDREAERLLKKSIQINPNDLEAFVLLGGISLRKKATSNAEKYFRKAFQIQPRDVQVLSGLAKTYERIGKRKQSIGYYRQVGEAKLLEYDFRSASSHFRAAHKLSKDVDDLFQSYMASFSYETLPRLRIKIEKSLFNRVNHRLYNLLGMIASFGKNEDLAREHFKKAILFDRNNAQAKTWLAYVNQNRKNLDRKSRKLLQEAVKIQPSSYKAKYLLAQFQIKDSKFEESQKLTESMLSLEPNNVQLLNLLGKVSYLNRNFSLSEESYSQILKISPNFLEAVEGIAKIHLSTRNYPKIYGSLTKVFENNPVNNFFLTNLGSNEIEGISHYDVVQNAKVFPRDRSYTDKTAYQKVIVVEQKRSLNIPQKISAFFSPYSLNENKLGQIIGYGFFSRYQVVSSQRGSLIFDQIDSLEDLYESAEFKEVLDRRLADAMIVYRPIRWSEQDHHKVFVDFKFFDFQNFSQKVEPKIESKLEGRFAKSEGVLVFNYSIYFKYFLFFVLPLLSIIGYLVYYKLEQGLGVLKVVVDFDPKLETNLSIRLSTSQQEIKNQTTIELGKKKPSQLSKWIPGVGKYVRENVGDETMFDRLPAKQYYCNLSGVINDATGREVGKYNLSQKVLVEKQKVSILYFDLQKREAFVNFHSISGEESVNSEIRIEGYNKTLYTTIEKSAFAYLEPGVYRISASSGEKVLNQEVEVVGTKDQHVYLDFQYCKSQGDAQEDAIEVATPQSEAEIEELVAQKDYARAAEAYDEIGNFDLAQKMKGYASIQGKDFEAAKKYFEAANCFDLLSKLHVKLGEKIEAHEAMAMHHLKNDNQVEAAKEYIQAGNLAEAAELLESVGKIEFAAKVMVKAQEYSQAGHLYAQVEKYEDAAKCFEKSGEYDQAAFVYKSAGKHEKILEMYLRSGKYLEAAMHAKDIQDFESAIKICDSVAPDHIQFVGSQFIKAEVLVEQNDAKQALNIFNLLARDYWNDFRPDNKYQYARLLEKFEATEQAIKVYKDIDKQVSNFKDVSVRLQKISG